MPSSTRLVTRYTSTTPDGGTQVEENVFFFSVYLHFSRIKSDITLFKSSGLLIKLGLYVCRFPTQQVLHALSWLDDLGADGGAADAVQDVIGIGDDLKSDNTGTSVMIYF